MYMRYLKKNKYMYNKVLMSASPSENVGVIKYFNKEILQETQV